MSVAFEGDARAAAAVKHAEEQALVRKAQAGDRLAFEELVGRFDRDVLRLALLPSPGRSGAVLADQRVIDTAVEPHVEPRVVAAPNGELASPVPTVLTAS